MFDNDVWGFDYNFTNYNFKRSLELQKYNLDLHV